MLKAANNDCPLTDLDDIAEMRLEAGGAKICHDAKRYVGVPNLLDLAAATCLELQRESAEFGVAAREREFTSQTDRGAAKGHWRAILSRMRSLQYDLAAMTAAMDEATFAKFDEAIEAKPAPAELVARG